MDATRAIRIVIGCHSYVLGEGIKGLVSGDDGIDVIGIFDEGIDVGEMKTLHPDIIVADFKIFMSFPENFLRESKPKILLVSDRSWFSGSKLQVSELLARGVSGILPPHADSGVLKKALRAVHAGELWIDRKVMKDVLYTMSHMDQEVYLTKKEKEIVDLICHGYRNKEIARRLAITERTVKSHCNRIFKKMGVSDRLQLALHRHRLWTQIPMSR